MLDATLCVSHSSSTLAVTTMTCRHSISFWVSCLNTMSDRTLAKRLYLATLWMTDGWRRMPAILSTGHGWSSEPILTGELTKHHDRAEWNLTSVSFHRGISATQLPTSFKKKAPQTIISDFIFLCCGLFWIVELSCYYGFFPWFCLPELGGDSLNHVNIFVLLLFFRNWITSMKTEYCCAVECRVNLVYRKPVCWSFVPRGH